MELRQCGKIRQNDEFYCPLCHYRWAINDSKPGNCNPIEAPTQINSPTTSKNRFRQTQKRAKRFRGYR